MTSDSERAIAVVNAAIEAEIDRPGPLNAREAAQRIMKEVGQRALRAYAFALAEDHLASVVGYRVRMKRLEAERFASDEPARAFRAAALFAADGNSDALKGLLDQRFYADEGYTTLVLAEMRAKHLVFAATYHEKLADGNARKAAFLHFVAKKVGSKTVGEVYSEERIAKVWESFVRRPAESAA